MKITPNHRSESNQEQMAQSSTSSFHDDNIPYTDNSTSSNIHLGKELIPYSSLSQEQHKRLQQMDLEPEGKRSLLPIEILCQEWGFDLWIGNKLNPLVVDFGMNWIAQSRIKMSRSQVYKAIQRAATKAGFFCEKARQEHRLNTEQKRLPSKI